VTGVTGVCVGRRVCVARRATQVHVGLAETRVRWVLVVSQGSLVCVVSLASLARVVLQVLLVFVVLVVCLARGVSRVHQGPKAKVVAQVPQGGRVLVVSQAKLARGARLARLASEVLVVTAASKASRANRASVATMVKEGRQAAMASTASVVCVGSQACLELVVHVAPRDPPAWACLARRVVLGRVDFLVCRVSLVAKVVLAETESMAEEGRREKMAKTAKMARMARQAKRAQRACQERKDPRGTAVNPSFRCISMRSRAMWT